MTYDQNNVRSLLEKLGVGHFNATMMIEDSFIAPATSDPNSPQIILMVRALQKKLGVPISGVLDDATADALAARVGPGWMSLSWGDNIATVLAQQAKIPPYSVTAQRMLRPTPPDPNLMSSLEGVFDFLPDLPGGVIAYGVIGYLAYRYLQKRRKA